MQRNLNHLIGWNHWIGLTPVLFMLVQGFENVK